MENLKKFRFISPMEHMKMEIDSIISRVMIQYTEKDPRQLELPFTWGGDKQEDSLSNDRGDLNGHI